MTARERRVIRWGAIAAGAILLFVLVLDPFLARSSETRVLIEQRELQLGRLTALQRALPRYRDRLGHARRIWNEDVAPRLLAAELPAVAASALSQEVRRIALQSFLEVERETVLPAVDDGGIIGVPVQFSLGGDVYGARDFLAAVETAPAFLHVRELRVSSVSGGFARVASGGAPLQIVVTIQGYLRGTEGPRVPGALPAEGAAPSPADVGSTVPSETSTSGVETPLSPPAGAVTTDSPPAESDVVSSNAEPALVPPAATGTNTDVDAPGPALRGSPRAGVRQIGPSKTAIPSASKHTTPLRSRDSLR